MHFATTVRTQRKTTVVYTMSASVLCDSVVVVTSDKWEATPPGATSRSSANGSNPPPLDHNIVCVKIKPPCPYAFG